METQPVNNDVAIAPSQSKTGWRQINNLKLTLFLIPLLLVRLYEDGNVNFLQRILLLITVFAVAYGWSVLFAKRAFKKPNIDQLYFAILFTVFLPAQVGWGGAILAASFGWVFAHEVFGAKGFISPALLALAFGIFSFSLDAYEIKSLFFAKFNLALALACLPVFLWMLWVDALSRRVVIGAVLGVGIAVATLSAPQSPLWWEHLILGTFFPGILFIAASSQTAPKTPQAQWLYGAIIGGLIITIRLSNPAQPDGVVFALLLGSLIAPLIDRAIGWRPSHE
ncbi:MAG: RnfABCDGE type electron transport complex subunit D [Rhodospirillaceae bacterium]|nr:RnfABCDGE type electron transport complex subunit D [Rhodospirillaceae bacterium]